MQVDDPPYLSVGTAVSAKYKGAFCEAKVNKVDRLVKCKVTYKSGLGAATVTDNDIKGTLRVGQHVQAKHLDRKELVEATITKIQDCSQYTVVFDDGDITTLRRTALCLKSGRHFNESETLDQLPLTHPEHFSNPVVGGRRGRRNRRDMKDDSSEEEIEEENNPDLERYSHDIGKIVSIESGEKKRGKESWFPGVVVIPSLQKSVNVKDEYLIRSFKDGRFYTVPKKETSEFNRDLAQKVSESTLVEAVQKAVKFLDYSELPQHWDKCTLFNTGNDSDDDANITESSDDEPSEEKDRFVAQLYKFMDDSGTPLNKTPTVSNRDIDLHRLFRVVQKMGGYNRVTNHNKWRSVAIKLKLPNNQNVSNQVKSAYKKCLLSYESFHRTLGVTMLNPVRKKSNGNKGRSLIRDKDRNTPANSPRPEREDTFVEKVEVKKEPPTEKIDPRAKKKVVETPKAESRKTKSLSVQEEASDTDTSDATASTSTARPKRKERKILVKDKPLVPEKVKEKEKVAEEIPKKKEKEVKEEKVEKPETSGIKKEKEEKDKTLQRQLTRSKSQISIKIKENPLPQVKAPKEKQPETAESTPKPSSRKTSVTAATGPPIPPKPKEKEKEKEEDKEKDKKPPKPKKKLTSTSDKSSSESSSSITETREIHTGPVNLGDKLHVYYGPTNESKVTYEAKVVDIDKDATGPIYLVHYTGWNTRYDEWIPAIRIAENLSINPKTGRKQKAFSTSNQPNKAVPPNSKEPLSALIRDAKDIPKRGRLSSVSSRAGASDQTPRSTTPSSITSSSSQTKSPSTPATRSVRLAAKRDLAKRRRTSAQTDISMPSEESESDDLSESEPELSRTRSGSIKTEPETDLKTYKPKVVRNIAKPDKRKVPEKEIEDTEKEEEKETEKKIPIKKLRRVKKQPVEKPPPEDSDDDESSKEAKGRDFDLNQIRSELKGFTKAVVKAPSTEDNERESISSSEDSNSTAPPSIDKQEELEEEKPEVATVDPIVLEPSAPTPKEEPKPPILEKLEKIEKVSESSDDIYEFKEPEPFEFESRSLTDDKNIKKRIPRLFEESPKSKLNKSVLSDDSPKSINTKAPERRTYGRAPRRRRDSDDSDEEIDIGEPLKNLDPFDKLVVSPCFNVVSKVSPDKTTENKSAPVKPVAEEPSLNLFKDLPDNSDEFSPDNMDMSDSESQPLEMFAINKPSTSTSLFSSSFSKASSPDRKSLDIDFSSSKNDEGKTTNSISDEDEIIQAQIQRVIAQTSSTDDDSNDILISSAFKLKSIEERQKETLSDILGITPNTVVETSKVVEDEAILESTIKEPKKEEPSEKVKEEKESKQISPALQETDSSLLELIVSKPPMLLNPKVDDTGKELTVKTGTKIADSILQKFSFIKNNIEGKKDEKPSTSKKDVKDNKDDNNKVNVDVKKETSAIPENKPDVKTDNDKAVKSEPLRKNSTDVEEKKPKDEEEKIEVKEPERSPTPEVIDASVRPKRRRAISKAYVEESSDDSSDSDQLVIAKSDDEDGSRNTNYPYKPSPHPTDRSRDDGHSSIKKTFAMDSKKPEERNFKFEDIKPKDEKLKEDSVNSPMEIDEEKAVAKGACKKEETKEEQPDSRFDSLLFCEEELPRSPAPAPESSQIADVPSGLSVHEIPFASAPGTSGTSASNNKIIIEEKKPAPVHPHPHPVHRPQLMMPVDRRLADVQAVIDNTPPTTPETSVSNSPRDNEHDDISAANDSGKSNDGDDYRSHRRSIGNKVSPYSEEDTMMTGEMSSSSKKMSDSFGAPHPGRKRRKSMRDDEPKAPAKRGRKPRIRRDSDSDDASENSTCGSGVGGSKPGSSTSYYANRSPRPSKYNFFVEFDPSLDSNQRIAVLQQKLTELRKTYTDVKQELAAVERRRKKLRRREREALKMAKQEMACA